jgi:hypothetical protein
VTSGGTRDRQADRQSEVSSTCAMQTFVNLRIFKDFKGTNSTDILGSAGLFYPEDGGSRFLRNLVTYLPTTRRQVSEYSNLRPI